MTLAFLFEAVSKAGHFSSVVFQLLAERNFWFNIAASVL